ncbi:MAG: hypothetical protein WAW42_10625 [Candidatus Competibacteraceae bacterium]
MKIEFQDLPWHDAEILSIFIDRENAGEQDTIRLSIRWPDESESVVVFSDCYALSAMMNFGVIAPESVLSGEVVGSREDLEEIKQRWSHVGVDLAGLRCYQLETNSTASKILIYALGFSVQ